MEDPNKDPQEGELENQEHGPGRDPDPPEESSNPGNPGKATSPNIKIVINVKGTKAVVGVQSPGCDPIFGMVEGNRDEIAQGALRILAHAEEKWKTSPRNPSIELPKPTVQTPPAAPSKSKAVPTVGQKSKAQPAMF